MVESLCAMTMTVKSPSLISSSKAFCTKDSLSASSAEVASSRSKILGLLKRALAIAILYF